MSVREMIELLSTAEPEAEVFISSDEEGNSYRKANVSFPETMCHQKPDWVSVHPDDLTNGVYEGWEDKMVNAVVVW